MAQKPWGPLSILTGLAIFAVCLAAGGCFTPERLVAEGSMVGDAKVRAQNPGAHPGTYPGGYQTNYRPNPRGRVQQASHQDYEVPVQEVPGRPMPNGPCPGPGCPGGPGMMPGMMSGGDMGEPGTIPRPMPRELTMTSHPPYTVAPPDILFIDALRMIPRPPYRIEPLEVLLINVSETLPNQPIQGPFTVSPEGTLNLGFGYGTVRIGGLTLDQAQEAIQRHLGNVLRNPQVSLALAQVRGMQQVRGQHLVRPDGTISLGTFGSVYVAGMTLGQVKCVLEKHMSNYVLDPQISVDVFAYNSKVFYLIYDGGGYGQQVFRLPITGNETVLDAVSQVQGLASVSSKKRIWLARPSPANNGCNQILPVDWNAITQAGSTATNYQLLPGDRVYVDANKLIALDNYLAQILAPVERILGVTFLGANTIQAVRSVGSGSGGGVGVITTVP